MDFQALDKKFPFQSPDAVDTSVLETFPYEYVGREIEVEIVCDEFTAVCPYSGLPDFGTITIRYVPDQVCVELRSLKYYLLSYRNVGIFYEHLVNRLLIDLVQVMQPRRMTIEADYKVRGGMKTRASAVWTKPATIP
ncbi:MAG: NADPH-dependent 7-cyano-7-deazaguanine reductase QueF [Calditrichaeota bacterium]|nr:NADPH-dependent 7-cyano-7-deazaguanine reductase QueF [Calditrichota bacterium]